MSEGVSSMLGSQYARASCGVVGRGSDSGHNAGNYIPVRHKLIIKITETVPACYNKNTY